MSFHPFRALAFGLLSRITQEVHLLDQLAKGIGSLVFPYIIHTEKELPICIYTGFGRSPKGLH